MVAMESRAMVFSFSEIQFFWGWKSEFGFAGSLDRSIGHYIHVVVNLFII